MQRSVPVLGWQIRGRIRKGCEDLLDDCLNKLETEFVELQERADAAAKQRKKKIDGALTRARERVQAVGEAHAYGKVLDSPFPGPEASKT